MKKLVIIIIVLMSIIQLSAKQKIVFAIEDEESYPSYVGSGEQLNAEKPGVSVEIIQLVAKELDLDIEIIRLPWQRCLETMKSNEIDGIFEASFKKARMEMGNYPMKDGKPDSDLRLLTASYYLYKLKDSPLAWDGKSFSNLDGAIGAPMGYSIVSDLKGLGVNVDESKSTDIDMKKLLRGRIAGVASLEFTGDKVIASSSEFSNIIKVEPPIKVKPYYLMLSHKFVDENPELAKKIWKTVQKIRDAKYQIIKKKYF